MFSIRRPSTPSDWLQTRAVLLDSIEWMRAALGIDLSIEQPSVVAELADLPGTYDGERAAMLTAVAGPDGLVVGTIGVRCHADGTAELKRMYVRAVARRQGVGEALLGAAVEFARRRGAHTMWLETSRGPMDPAIALYARNGFVEVAARPGELRIDRLVVMERPVEPVPVASSCAPAGRPAAVG
jgi:GNAT superfamily N-acetyltransferase